MRALALLASVSLGACTTLQWPTPEGWERSGATLTSPDGAVHVHVFEEKESDPEAAAQAAWRSLKPGVTLTRSGDPVRWPPSRGWEAETSLAFAAGDAKVRAEVRRFRDTSYVVLVEGDEAAQARRDAQIDAVLSGLTVKGLRDESFEGQPVRALDVAALDAFIAAALEKLEVPGAAVAVVHGGRTVYERTLGVRALGATEPITPDTLFLMASVTKPMTTLMQAALVDAGLLGWHTKLSTVLPSFRLGDPKLGAQLELWHMSCACTGMPRRDLEYLFEYASVTPEQRIASLAEMKPTTALGETFQYSNLMVAAGGFAAAHAYAPELSFTDAYAKAMQDQVFAKAGMTRSTLDFDTVAKSEHASPHALDLDGHVTLMPLAIERNVLPIAPAGAVWSTLHDMERYALTELAHGGEVASRASHAERWKKRIGEGPSGYGLGIDVEQRAGLQLIGHDGGAMGFGTSLLLLPSLDLGIVVLTNVRNGNAFEQLPFNAAVKRRVLELLFASARPRAQLVVDASLGFRRDGVKRAAGVERAPAASWLKSLEGTYRHPTLGTVEVHGAVLDAGEWQVRFGRLGNDVAVLDAPFAGSVIEVGDGTLKLPDPQVSYVLKRR